MHRRFLAVLMLFALAGCAGGSSSNAPAPAGLMQSAPQDVTTSDIRSPESIGPNVVQNPGFESGNNNWSLTCGSVSGPSVSTAQKHGGTESMLIGTTSKPEVNGTKAVCQTVTMPAGTVTLSFWVYEGTNDTITYVDQEADVISTGGTVLKQLYKEAKSTGGWVQKTFDVSQFAGQQVRLYFGIKGNGYASDYVYMYLDDVSLTGSSGGATPTPVPSSTPTPVPSSTPTSNPTAYPCNNSQFQTYQSEFAAGSISADQFVDVCGKVTQVLPKKTTTSGTHGYFYVQMPNGYNIEIVSNLDAMAEASTDRPPTTWPWVSVGQYVYVQGRYYYDSASSQGIDWTEDDTSGSWPHVGWVAVCNSSGASCNKYW